MCSCPAHRALVDCVCSCDHSGDRISQWKARALAAEQALGDLLAKLVRTEETGDTT